MEHTNNYSARPSHQFTEDGPTFEVYEDSSNDLISSPILGEKLMFDNSPKLFSDVKDKFNDNTSKLSYSDLYKSHNENESIAYNLYTSNLQIIIF
jgi:hypothetical protein